MKRLLVCISLFFPAICSASDASQQPGLLQGKNWSIQKVNKDHLKKIENALTRINTEGSSSEKGQTTYLFDGTAQDPTRITKIWVKKSIARSQTNPANPFQWFWYESLNEDQSVKADGFIVVQRQPRAVADPDSQSEILEFYHKQQVLEKEADGEAKKYLGQYRAKKDASMLEIRLVQNIKSSDMTAETQVLKKVVQYCTKMKDRAPAPSYPTDKAEDKPRFLVSYATLLPSVISCYLKAGFSKHSSKAFREFFPPGARKDLAAETPLLILDMEKAI